MEYRITVLPEKMILSGKNGEILLPLLRSAGLFPEAPCGGEGHCGKCRVLVDGQEVLACQTVVDRDMTVLLPENGAQTVLTETFSCRKTNSAMQSGYLLAIDIGTTTVAGYLLDGRTGEELAVASRHNSQAAFGADVITRIRHGIRGCGEELTGRIRNCLKEMTLELCSRAEISSDDISLVCAVGNPAMQQFLLGISMENLAKVPFAPVLTQLKMIPAGDILPAWKQGDFLVIPDMAGFLGADTVAGVLETGMLDRKETTLLVDIGTNGEMVLGNSHRLIACSAAAGPALEGAGIQFGMRGQTGAIDHVRLENGQVRCSVIGGGAARGICGSGLIDAVAVALEQGLLNERGKILTVDQVVRLTDGIYLTQEDIRQVQLAKGAIAAGIQLMTNCMGISFSDISQVYLAGAFGTYMDPKSACRIGLLPKELEDRITAVGNAAGSGVKHLVCNPEIRQQAQEIVSMTEILELSELPEFPRCFAKNMRF